MKTLEEIKEAFKELDEGLLLNQVTMLEPAIIVIHC
jgi:hypothetical protein